MLGLIFVLILIFGGLSTQAKKQKKLEVLERYDQYLKINKRLEAPVAGLLKEKLVHERNIATLIFVVFMILAFLCLPANKQTKSDTKPDTDARQVSDTI